MYKTVLFDLDGTLTDSGPGIFNSVRYAVNDLKLREISEENLRKFIGPPLVDSFSAYCGLDKEGASRAVESYRTYYREKGIYENEVYDGVRHMLQTLKEHGVKIVLATSKPEVFAKIVLEHFDLTKYFDFIAGAMTDESRNTKAMVIRYALESFAAPQPIIMVGDRQHDVLGAKENGLPCIGVLYGYGSKQELVDSGAIYVAKTPAEVAKIVLMHNF